MSQAILEALEQQKAEAENAVRILDKAIVALKELNAVHTLTGAATGESRVAEPSTGRRPKPYKWPAPVECGSCHKRTRWNPCEHCNRGLKR
jgi:hypothetical protein